MNEKWSGGTTDASRVYEMVDVWFGNTLEMSFICWMKPSFFFRSICNTDVPYRHRLELKKNI